MGLVQSRLVDNMRTLTVVYTMLHGLASWPSSRIRPCRVEQYTTGPTLTLTHLCELTPKRVQDSGWLMSFQVDPTQPDSPSALMVIHNLALTPKET